MELYSLPETAVFGGREYAMATDFRRVIPILGVLEDPARPEALRWYLALELFYKPRIPTEYAREAMEYMARFLSWGEEGRPGPKLFDWQQDARAILADVNRVAGREIRLEEKVHWWTFLSWFYAIGEGQLSNLVSIRQKLARGQKLEGWEQEFYRGHKAQIQLRPPQTPEQLAQKQALEQLLS